MSMKAGKHFVVKDSTEMRFEVIFCSDAHSLIYPKESQNWYGRSKFKKKGRNWHKSAVPWVLAERIKKHLKLAQRVSTNWQFQVFCCTNCCLAFISLSSIAMVWTSWRRFCQNYQPLQKQRSCEIGSRLKLWPLFVTKRPGICKKAAGIRMMIYM